MFSIRISPDTGGFSFNDSGSRFLQSDLWAQFKSLHGWKPLKFSVIYTCGEKEHSFSLIVLVRTFGKAFLKLSIAYIPMQPELFDQSADAVEQIPSYVVFLKELAGELKRYLPRNVLCIRYDPPLDFYACEKRDEFVKQIEMNALMNHLNIVKTKVDIQPPDTVLLDITQSSDEMLEHMRNKWRYNIHLAEKKGVIVTGYKAGVDDVNSQLSVFYDLYKTTAERDGIAIHSKQYYEDLFALSADKRKTTDAPLITLYIARHENDNLAAIITLFSKREAVYLYGASSNIKRNLMPAYLLQWTAICDAKNYGAPVYDFYGMPPTDDKNHPMYGLYLFKTGFGGTIVHRPGSIDVPVSPLYKAYIAAEDVRAFYHKKVRKILAGRA